MEASNSPNIKDYKSVITMFCCDKTRRQSIFICTLKKRSSQFLPEYQMGFPSTRGGSDADEQYQCRKNAIMIIFNPLLCGAFTCISWYIYLHRCKTIAYINDIFKFCQWHKFLELWSLYIQYCWFPIMFLWNAWRRKPRITFFNCKKYLDVWIDC